MNMNQMEKFKPFIEEKNPPDLSNVETWPQKREKS